MSAGDAASPRKGLAALLPVAGGLAVIAGLAAVVILREPTPSRGREVNATATAPPSPPPIVSKAAPPAEHAHAHAPSPLASGEIVPAYPEEEKKNLPVPPSERDQTDGPSFVAAKPKMNVEEKLAETKKHLPTMEHHAEALEQEIKEAERSGRADEAAEKRIRVKRLRAHIADLQKAIDEKREPQ